MPPARQPFTFGGVARFAHASAGRLLLTGLLFGLVTGIALSVLAGRYWAPVVDEAVASLPANSMVDDGTLRWPERSGRLLGANPFLSFEVVLNEQRADRAPVDLAFELHPQHIGVRSLFGNASLPYPPRAAFKLNRTTLVPTWGAWRGPALFALIPATAILLLVTWSILAIPYAIVARTIGAMFRRDLDFRRAWKLCVAAQLPGSILMIFAIALYAAGQVSILFIGVMLVAHFVPTILYVLISPILVPRKPKPPRSKDKNNPFDSNDSEPGVRGKNPFANR